MTATQRIRSMLDGSPVKEIGACGWLHTIGADRDTAEVFSSAIIKMTDYSKWDFIKVMPNGVYNQEAHGSDIEYFSGPLSVEDLKAKRVFQFHRYLINSVKDMEAFPVLDVSKNAVYQREVNVVRALAKHYQGTVPVIPTIFTPAHCIPEFCGGIEQARYYMDNHPEAVDAMLRALVQTELQLVDAYIEAGADGFFFAQRYSNADILSEQEFERFCRPYDEMLLARAHGRTWFNMVHVHGAKNFFWDQFKTYDVQALSWENTPQQIPETMEQVFQLFPKLRDRRKQIAGTLSGGEQQMLAVGRAMMAKPRLLLLDEPSLGLAPLVIKEIFDMIDKIRDMGTTILLVEQNARVALRHSDRAYVLETGRIVLSDTAQALLNSDMVRKAYLGGL